MGSESEEEEQQSPDESKEEATVSNGPTKSGEPKVNKDGIDMNSI